MAGRGGRPKGSPNKRTLEFLAVLEKHDFCPATAMIETYHKACKQFEVWCKDTDPDGHAPKYLKIASESAANLASYAYARRKAIDMNVNPQVLDQIKVYEGKSTEELLAILEKEIKDRSVIKI